MSLHVNDKEYMANIIIDKGLANVNINSNDIRPGKISIDKHGNKLESVSIEEFLKNLTFDANVKSGDITNGKIIYANGERLIGSAPIINTKSDLINGTVQSYTVATNTTIKSGDFINITSGTIYKYNGTNTISGVAIQDGITGNTIEVIVPN